VKKRVLKTKIGSTEKAAKEFVAAWHKIESSEMTESDERLYFESAETLLKTLTPKRLELLREIHKEKNYSIRALAKNLGRDYKNVHQDVTVLLQIGLIVKMKDGSVTVPWSSIITEIPMSSNSNTNKKRAAGGGRR